MFHSEFSVIFANVEEHDGETVKLYENAYEHVRFF